MSAPLSGWHRAIVELLTATELVQPSSLARAINDAVRPLGVTVTLFLVDPEQRNLRVLAEPGTTAGGPVPIDSSLAGQAFMTVQIMVPEGQSDRLWIPILDGSERLGAAEVLLPESAPNSDPRVQADLTAMMRAVGHLIVAKTAYGDFLRQTRRSQPMSTEGELLWRSLPPLTVSAENLVISAVLEPCYQVGGDAFDYAVDGDRAMLAIFDAVGHGLTAGMTSVLTLAAVRAARSGGAGLAGIAGAADRALVSQFDDLRYTTAFLADLEMATGTLHYLNAGHPAPVLIREGKVLAELNGARRMPLGLTDPLKDVAEHTLTPGDRLLLYTDGIIEARDPRGGEPFGLDRLVEFIERHWEAGLPAPETLRRLSHAVLDHQQGLLDDDATLMIVEWSGPPGERITS